MIITRTPFRISFFGGGTDYPVWYREHGGAVLATSINKYCYISVRYLPPFFDYSSRIVWSKIETVKNASDIEHPSVRACLKFLSVNKGVALHHDADLPARSGLGSSSAFTVGLLNALYGLKGKMAGKKHLADEAIHVEQELLKEYVGCQDQITAAHGGFNHIEFTCNAPSIVPVVLPQEKLAALQDHLLLFFTGLSRTASDVAKKQIEVTASKKEELQLMYAMVGTGLDILKNSSDLSDFGRLLHESWKIKRSLTDKISNSQIDEIYKAAREAGAIGGKLMGAGGGGFMVLFAKPERHDEIKKKLSSLLHVPFRFEKSGSQVIFYDPENR